jgi:hypothetical protein
VPRASTPETVVSPAPPKVMAVLFPLTGGAEGEQAGVRVEARGTCKCDGAAVGVEAADVAQRAVVGNAASIEGERLRSHADATLQLQGRAACHGCRACCCAKRGCVLNIERARRDGRGSGEVLVSAEGEGGGTVFHRTHPAPVRRPAPPPELTVNAFAAASSSAPPLSVPIVRSLPR